MDPQTEDAHVEQLYQFINKNSAKGYVAPGEGHVSLTSKF